MRKTHTITMFPAILILFAWPSSFPPCRCPIVLFRLSYDMISCSFRSLASFGGKFCVCCMGLFYTWLTFCSLVFNPGLVTNGTASDKSQMDYDVNGEVELFNEVFE